jgi:hypothetical protein
MENCFFKCNIKLIPQSEAVNKENRERFARKLKVDDYYDKWGNELEEFL